MSSSSLSELGSQLRAHSSAATAEHVNRILLVDLLAAAVQAAGQQHLLDQGVQLGDIGLDLEACRRCCAVPAPASSNIAKAIFRRARGERSSWLALASRL